MSKEGTMPARLVLFLYESWRLLDGAVNGLSREEATAREGTNSSIAWTVGHVTNMLDGWVNMRFQGLTPHPFISLPNFRTGGDGNERDWLKVLASVKEVRAAAREYLDCLQDSDLDRVIPYDGGIDFLRTRGLSLRYALERTSAHHYLHFGEIMTIRSQMGHAVNTLFGSDWGRALA
jgi:hypothetical protein